MDASPLIDRSGSEPSPYLAEHLERFPEPPHAASNPHDNAIGPSELVRTSSPANEDTDQGRDDAADKTVEPGPQLEEEQIEEQHEASPPPKPMSMLGLDAELDALDTAMPVPSGSNQGPSTEESDGQTGQSITVADEKPFSFASTPSSPMQVLTHPQSLSRSNSAAQSVSSSTSTASLSSQNSSNKPRTPVSQSSAAAASDAKIKRRSSLLGVLGLNKSNSKKGKSSSSLGASMSSIFESDTVSKTSSLGGASASQQARRQNSLRKAASASNSPRPGGSPSLSSSTSSQISKKLTRPPHSAPPSALLTSSMKSIPPFPVTREHLQPFKQRAEFLMKFSPFGWRQLSKHGAWRPRFMLLSAIPALKTANDVPLGGHHFILSAFKTNEMQDEEVERIRLTKDTVICVTDEIGGGRLYVLKVADAVAANGSQEPWFFSLNDVSDLTVWLRLLKSLVLQLRGVKAADKESTPVHQDKPLPEIDDSAIHQHRAAFSDIALELDADDGVQHHVEEPASIQHPFASLASHQSLATEHRHHRRRNLSQDSSINARPWGHLEAGQWAHSDDLSPELHVMRRMSASGSQSGDDQHHFGLAHSQSMLRTAPSPRSSNGSFPLSTGLSAAGPLRTQAPTAPLPPLPPGARPPNPRLSVYSQSSDDTSLSHFGSSSLSNSSCGKRISASSGGSSFTSPGSSMASRSMHNKPTEHGTPPVPTRSPLRKSPQATSVHFAAQPLPAPPTSAPSSTAFQPTKLVSHLPEHREVETASTSLFEEVTNREDEEDAQLRAFSLSQDFPQEAATAERRPQIRFDA